MARFRVIGGHTVQGVKPGDVLEVDEDTTLNLGALISGGHLELLDDQPTLDAPPLPQEGEPSEDVESNRDEG